MREQEHIAYFMAAVAGINPRTADVCRVRCDVLGDHAVPGGKLFFYRGPNNRFWVPEHIIPQELNVKMKTRIKRLRIEVLWKSQCDN